MSYSTIKEWAHLHKEVLEEEDRCLGDFGADVPQKVDRSVEELLSRVCEGRSQQLNEEDYVVLKDVVLLLDLKLALSDAGGALPVQKLRKKLEEGRVVARVPESHPG
jgi:hypothetical protein